MDFQSLREHATPIPNNYNMNRFGFRDHTNSYNNTINNNHYQNNGNNRNIPTNNTNTMNYNHNNIQSNIPPNKMNMRHNYNHRFTNQNQNCNEYVRKNLNKSFNEFELSNPKPDNNCNPNPGNSSYLSSENLKKLNESYESENQPTNNNYEQNYNNYNNIKYNNNIQSENRNNSRFQQLCNNGSMPPMDDEDIDISVGNNIINNNKYGKKKDIKYTLNVIEEIKKELNNLTKDFSLRKSESEMLKERVHCLQLQHNLQNNDIFHLSKQENLYSESNIMNNKQKTIQNRRNRKRRFDDMSINNDFTFNKKRRMNQQFSG